MERPTREVKLPQTGYTAHIVTFFTRVEMTKILSKRYEGAEAGVDEDGKTFIQNLNPQSTRFEDNEMLRVGVKKVVDSDGKDVALTDACGNLPDGDTDILVRELLKHRNRPKPKKKLEESVN